MKKHLKSIGMVQLVVYLLLRQKQLKKQSQLQKVMITQSQLII